MKQEGGGGGGVRDSVDGTGVQSKTVAMETNRWQLYRVQGHDLESRIRPRTHQMTTKHNLELNL